MKKLFFLLVIFISLKANANIFVKIGNKYVLQEKCDKCSINDRLKELGYDTNQFYSYYGNIESDIFGVYFKIFTTDIICVSTQNNITELRKQDIEKYLSDFVFSLAYSVYNREEDLKDGLKKGNLSIKFLSNVLNISCDTNSLDTMLTCEKYGYNLYFRNGYLDNFESSDGYNSDAKDFMECNPDYFNTMKVYAKEYWKDDEYNIKKEINIQCKAFNSLPYGWYNEHLKDFYEIYNYYNFKIIAVLYYNDTITIREFKDICHGNAKFIEAKNINDKKVYIYEYKNALFVFLENGKLLMSKPS